MDAVVRPKVIQGERHEKTMDVAAPCELGASGAWPQRWGYGVRVFLSGDKPVTAAQTAVRVLQAEGWSVQMKPSTEDVVEADARKDDILLHVLGEPTPPSLIVEGYGACVQADGTTRRS